MTKKRFADIASRKRLAYGALTIIVLFILEAHAVFRQFSSGTKDFHHFYRAAVAMWNGIDIYAAASGHYICPPFLAFILQPLALMPEHMAAIIWIVLSGVFVFAAALIAGAIVLFIVWSRRRGALWLLAGAVVPLAALLYYNLNFIGNLAGGYGLAAHKEFVRLNLSGMAGLLVSPARGLLVFSPFLVFIPVGLIQRLRAPC